MLENKTIIPEGGIILKITGIEYDEESGKLNIEMTTKDGRKHVEHFTLKKDGKSYNEKALKALAYFARVALNDPDIKSVDPDALVGHYISADVEHQKAERSKGLITRAHLKNIKSALSFDDMKTDDSTDEKVGSQPLVAKPLSDYDARSPEFLIPYWIVKNDINIIFGDGGVGKSTLWRNLVASISSGRESVLDRTPAIERSPGRVIVFASEDDPNCVIRPQLEGLGAELNNIILVEEKIEIGSERMELYLREIDPVAAIFDPYQSFLPMGMNMNSCNDTRSVLDKLRKALKETQTTGLLIMHSNKREDAGGRNRLGGSADEWDSARSVIVMGEDKSTGFKYISHEKSNYALHETTILVQIANGKIYYQRTSNKKDLDFQRDNTKARASHPERDACIEDIKSILSDAPNYTMTDKDLKETVERQFGYTESMYLKSKTELRNKGEITMAREHKAGGSYLVRLERTGQNTRG